jgi:ketosteroid isomerase-like protein
MSEQDVEVVRQGFEALDQGGVEALIELINPEFEFTTPPGLAAEPDTYKGAEGLRRYFDSFNEVMDEIAFEPGRIEDLGGGKVLAESKLTARGRTTGIEAEQRVVLVWGVRDGKASHLWVFGSEDEARTAMAGG